VKRSNVAVHCHGTWRDRGLDRGRVDVQRRRIDHLGDRFVADLG